MLPIRVFCRLPTRISCLLLFNFSYFPKSSTQEILDEIYPRLYPLDTGKICGAFDLLSIFLNPMQGYELWLDDFINLWNTYHNPSWNEVTTAVVYFWRMRIFNLWALIFSGRI